MLRSEFEGHRLWGLLNEVETQIAQLRAEGVASDLPPLERISLQLDWVRTFYKMRSTRVEFFVEPMLSPVADAWSSVSSYLAQRIADPVGYAGYVETAAVAAENALLQMAAWPRPFGRRDEAERLETLYQDLLERQRQSIAALDAVHTRLQGELETMVESTESKKTEVLEEFTATSKAAAELEAEVQRQAGRVDQAVTEGTQAIARLSNENSVSFDAWVVAQSSAIREEFQPIRDAVASLRASADEDYAELLGKKKEYERLVGAIAGEEIARDFKKEAIGGRWAAGVLYVLGLGCLALAAWPLIYLFVESVAADAKEIGWPVLALRISLAAIAGSAATILIRLGGKFIASSNASKRMELELKAIGPFLSYVTEAEKVDDARIDLIGKAFGKAFAAPESGNSEDTIPVSAFVQILEVAQKMSKQGAGHS